MFYLWMLEYAFQMLQSTHEGSKLPPTVSPVATGTAIGPTKNCDARFACYPRKQPSVAEQRAECCSMQNVSIFVLSPNGYREPEISNQFTVRRASTDRSMDNEVIIDEARRQLETLYRFFVIWSEPARRAASRGRKVIRNYVDFKIGDRFYLEARFRNTRSRTVAWLFPGNRNLARSYVPGDFTEELVDRGTISISDFSERARIVISRTCPLPFAAMHIPSWPTGSRRSRRSRRSNRSNRSNRSPRCRRYPKDLRLLFRRRTEYGQACRFANISVI